MLWEKNSSRGAKHGPSERQRTVLQGSRDAAESSPRKARKPFIHTCKMAQWLQIQNVSVRYWMDRGAHCATWQNCLGESFIRRNKIRENSKFDALDSHAEWRMSSATTTSTTWLWSSEKTVQEIARRTPGKDSHKTVEPFLAVNKQDSEKDERLRELNNMTMQSTLAQAGGSVKSRGESCRQLVVSRQQIGIETSGRRAVGIPSILHGLTTREFFSQELGPVSYDWRKNFQTTDGMV